MWRDWVQENSSITYWTWALMRPSALRANRKAKPDELMIAVLIQLITRMAAELVGASFCASHFAHSDM